ncbi:hypothetical protein BKA69DRAFT_1121621 [Paraphysoderma sedebokerense]|nr:hypothetical protein BKA69DRAFT_1121621 [Paraphysoderma sedebokerense]
MNDKKLFAASVVLLAIVIIGANSQGCPLPNPLMGMPDAMACNMDANPGQYFLYFKAAGVYYCGYLASGCTRPQYVILAQEQANNARRLISDAQGISGSCNSRVGAFFGCAKYSFPGISTDRIGPSNSGNPGNTGTSVNPSNGGTSSKNGRTGASFDTDSATVGDSPPSDFKVNSDTPPSKPDQSSEITPNFSPSSKLLHEALSIFKFLDSSFSTYHHLPTHIIETILHPGSDTAKSDNYVLSLGPWSISLPSWIVSIVATDIGIDGVLERELDETDVTKYWAKRDVAIDKLTKAWEEYENFDAGMMLADMNFYGNYSLPRNITRSLELYTVIASKNGNSTAQYKAGFIYATNLGGVLGSNITDTDQARAQLYLTFAANSGNTEAEAMLGYRYHAGIGCVQSCEDSVKFYKRVAAKVIDFYSSGPPGGRADPPPKIRLSYEDGGIYGPGSIYNAAEEGSNGALTEEDILEYYRHTAESGDISSQVLLGQLFYSGTPTIQQNFPRAHRYLSLAVAQYYNNPESSPSSNPQLPKVAGQAAGLLGKMYWRGDGVKADNKTALKWFARGAEQDDPGSMAALGVMLVEGHDVKKDVEKGYRFLNKAAEMENSEAQVQIGLMKLRQQDYPAAIRYLTQAGKKGHILAMFYLAELYIKGTGINRDCNMAALLYKLVTEKGLEWISPTISEAYHALTDGDADRALLLYLIAAERGFEVAQSNVAWLVDSAQIVSSPLHPSLHILSYVNWNRAANQGTTDARLKVGEYNFYGIGVEANEEKAVAYWTVAADVDKNAMAMWNLGWCFENGIGVVKDYHLSKRYYESALETNPDAWLPISLSLIKLNLKYWWETVTNFIQFESSDESAEIEGEVGSGGEDQGSTIKIEKEVVDEIQKEEIPKVNSDSSTSSSPDSGPDQFPSDTTDDDWNWSNLRRPTRSSIRKSSSIWYNLFGDESEEETIESFVILGLCLVVGWLVYVRNVRFGGQGQGQGQGQGAPWRAGFQGQGQRGVERDGERQGAAPRL